MHNTLCTWTDFREGGTQLFYQCECSSKDYQFVT